MEIKQIIEGLKEERKNLEEKISKIDRALSCFEDEEKKHIKTQSKIDKVLTLSKKQKAKELLEKKTLTIKQVAYRVGVCPATLYNWFPGISKGGTLYSKRPRFAHKKYKKNCSHCHEKPAKCLFQGKEVCKRCFDILKYGEPHVKNKEKKDAECYDDLDALAEELDE